MNASVDALLSHPEVKGSMEALQMTLEGLKTVLTIDVAATPNKIVNGNYVLGDVLTGRIEDVLNSGAYPAVNINPVKP